MADECVHAAGIRDVTPSALGCEECLKIGSPWVHLRLCRTCGHVGCCDSSPNRHATKHFHKTRHPSAMSTRLQWILADVPRRKMGRSRATFEFAYTHDARGRAWTPADAT